MTDPDEICCFACHWWDVVDHGSIRHLERAHVVPHASGGPDDDPGNFALLCRTCHRAAPDTSDSTWFWSWVAARQPCDPFARWTSLATAAADLLTEDQLEKLAARPASEEELDAAGAQLGVPAAPLSAATWARMHAEVLDARARGASPATN